jgi:hypothetical protein
MFRSDPIVQSSPLRPLPVKSPTPVLTSSPLSDCPLDREGEQIFLLGEGQRELIRWQPYEKRLEAALHYVRLG